MSKIVSLSIFFFTVIIGTGQALSDQLICLNGGESNKESNASVITNNNDSAIFYFGNWVLYLGCTRFLFK